MCYKVFASFWDLTDLILSAAYMLHVAPVVNLASRFKQVEMVPVVEPSNLQTSSSLSTLASSLLM